MEINYKTEVVGELTGVVYITPCPNGKKEKETQNRSFFNILFNTSIKVGSNLCDNCIFFKSKYYQNKVVVCSFKYIRL
jgi:hypothetical protein